VLFLTNTHFHTTLKSPRRSCQIQCIIILGGPAPTQVPVCRQHIRYPLRTSRIMPRSPSHHDTQSTINLQTHIMSDTMADSHSPQNSTLPTSHHTLLLSHTPLPPRSLHPPTPKTPNTPTVHMPPMTPPLPPASPPTLLSAHCVFEALQAMQWVLHSP